jgi:hypothetical protein
MEKPNLIESLDKMASLEVRLKELGVPADAIEDVMGHLDEYVELRDGLGVARNSQFYGDAYDILGEIKQASNKNVEALSVWLRKFALHIAAETVILTQIHGGYVDVIVDHIKPMATEEE